MACDVLWLNWTVKMKSPSALLLPTTAATSGFCQTLGLIPSTARGRREGARKRRKMRRWKQELGHGTAAFTPPLCSQPPQLLSGVQIVVKLTVKLIILVDI